MTLRFGIVGCGSVAGKHFNALKTLSEHATIAAVCSIHEDNLAAAVTTTGATPYSDYETMLQSASLDVVSICTASNLHVPHGIMAAKAGFHVIVEKPMATTMADAQTLVAECATRNVSLFVMQQWRFLDASMKLKRAIEAGLFGKLYLLTANIFWQRPQRYYDEAPWRGTRASDGGMFMNQANHMVDLIQWLVGGNTPRVSAALGTLERDIECEDTGVITLQWESGTMASLNATVLTYPRNMETSLTILGEKGSVRLSGGNLETTDYWEFADSSGISKLATSPYMDAHTRCYANVIDHLHGKAAALVSGEEALKTQALLEAIYDNAASAPFSRR